MTQGPLQATDDGLLEVIMPYIDQARGCLRRGIRALMQTQPSLPFDPDTAEMLLFAQLPPRLLQLLRRTMALELHVARLQGLLEGEQPEERFQSFVQRLRQRDVALALLQEYPVLARQLTVGIDNWRTFGLEFLHHLCCDWRAIQQTFHPERDAGRLVALQGGAGDSHRGGRAVIIATFDSGFPLVYKPRSLAVDVHFQELLTWLNQRGSHPPFRTLKILDRGTYGWAEFVAPQSCDTVELIQRFYERQGGYIALLHALAAIDFHFENLIAAGEHPVLVDIETLFHPSWEISNFQPADQPAARVLLDSVLRSGLLPYRVRTDAESEGVDLSGLGAVEGQRTLYHVPHWEGMGTDEMRFTRKQKRMAGGRNRPTLHGHEVDILDYVEAIVSGFTAVYRTLHQYRDDLLSIDGPLARFAGDDVRVVLRPTHTYHVLMYEASHPDVLRDARARDSLFDWLRVQAERNHHLRRAIPDEREDLQDNNIPKFTTHPGSHHLWSSSGRQVDNFFDESGMDYVQRRLHQFNDVELKKQIWLIRASLATTVRGASRTPIPTPPLTLSQIMATGPSLLSYAQAIGDWLVVQAIRSGNEATWLGMLCNNQGYWSLSPLGPDLAHGLSGVALFLAYLGAMTGDERYTELAHATLTTIRRQIVQYAAPPRGNKQRSTFIFPIGGFDGWGGIIYTLTHLSVLWNQPMLLSEAEAYGQLLPPLIDGDETLDIIGGVAGCLGGLLTLYRLAPSDQTLALAIRCGERLIERAQSMPMGVGWRAHIAPAEPLTGFAYGAAGMAWALLQLVACTGVKRFRQTALEAIASERSLLAVDPGKWSNARGCQSNAGTESHAQSRCMTSWCQGAPGIGLSRLHSLEHLHDAAVRAEINMALQTTLAQGFGHNHCLCHGDLGNLELLLQASLAFEEPRWKAAVHRLSASIAASIDHQGWLCGIPLGVQSPGLLTGLAGIGYELLRLAAPRRVPSVLVLEAPIRAC
jgi:class II lanthipeptide synthase